MSLFVVLSTAVDSCPAVKIPADPDARLESVIVKSVLDVLGYFVLMSAAMITLLRQELAARQQA